MHPRSDLSVAVVGVGWLGERLVERLLEAEITVRASHHRHERCAALEAAHGIPVTSDNRDACEGTHIVVLAVRPPQVPGVVAEIKSTFRPGQVVVSLAAALPLAWLDQACGPGVTAARIMLPPSFETGGGPALVSVAPTATPAAEETLRRLVEALGTPAAWVDDAALDVLTVTVTAVAPYLAAFLGSWSDWAVGNAPELDRDEVARMMVSSLSGVARQFERDGGFDATLRHAATPGGLTEAALSALRRAGVLDAIAIGPDAMRARAAEIGRTILADA